jgi:hypothetical protein
MDLAVSGCRPDPSSKISRSHPLSYSVNITSLSVPDARLDLDSINGPPLPDPRVIVTTYDLQWPNATATLNETVIRIDEQFGAGGQTSRNSSTYAPLCMAVIATPLWPNVTNKLKDNQDGDCNAVLGPECVTALLAPGGDCGLPNYRVDACRDTFGPNGYPEITGGCKSTTKSHITENKTLTTDFLANKQQSQAATGAATA